MISNAVVASHTLRNGLRVVAMYNPTSAMAAVNVLYNVGSRDEVRSKTGMAHLFEHLMFGGSVNVPNFDEVLENAGGKNNAWTSCDFTNFYDIVPASNIATAFYLESDRMLSLAFDEKSLEVQRDVVIEEFKQTHLNRPYGDLMHHLRAMVYNPEHSYSWPTIGLIPEHISAVTMDDVRRWFYTHYAPNNAIITVAGGVEPEQVFRLAEEWFGDIPRRDICARQMPAPYLLSDKCEKEIRADVPRPQIMIAFPMAAYGKPGYVEADVITDILAVGYSSRLFCRLINGPEGDLFASTDASIIGSEHEGMLLLSAMVTDNDDKHIARAKELLLSTAKTLADGELSERELQRTINTYESSLRLSNMNNASCALNLALAEIHGEDIEQQVRERRALTIEDITATASDIFCNSPSATIIYRPKK